MTAFSTCPECRRPIPSNAPAGLCPDCLLAQGLGADVPDVAGQSRSAAFAATTPQGSRMVAPDPRDLAPHFPQLEILELIGQGGMGAVYKARQQKLDRLVAVKIIRPEASDDPTFAERFMREARTLARLSHPNIVGVHDFGEIRTDASPLAGPGGNGTNGLVLFYFIMEYVDGVNLRQLMDAKQLPPELAVTIVPQICDALQFAHDEGVVHRDIKPENIMLDSRGRVKIADFGLAKLAGKATNDFTLTGTHQVMGTPRYMAPEQMAGSRDVDHRADIYSLGVVFYEMLTGDIPAGHFATPSQKSGVDVRWDEIVLKAMAREPERRFQSARELRSSVERISSGASASGHRRTAMAQSEPHPGFSTIVDREVFAAWRLVTGDSAKAADQRVKLPSLLLLLLCFSGIASVLLPWIEVTFEQNNRAGQVAQIPAGENEVAWLGEYQLCQSSVVESMPPRIIEPGTAHTFRGMDLSAGWGLCVCLAVIAILLVCIPERSRITIPASLATLGLSGLATLSVLLAHAEVQTIRFDVDRSSSDTSLAVAAETATMAGPGAFSALTAFQPCVLQDSAADQGPQSEIPDGFRRNITWLPTWFVPIGIATVLLLFSAASVRHAFGTQNPDKRASANRSDSVTVGQQEAETGLLPDVCMVCGCETHERVSVKIHHQPEWAQGLMMLGFFCGGIPGVIIAIMTSKEIRASTPICHDHRNHWNRLVLFASIGWLLPVVLGGIGAIIGTLISGDVLPDRSIFAAIGVVAGIVPGLILYLWPVIYLACTVVKCDMTHTDKITFSRVSSAFAWAVRQRQPSAAKP